MNRTARVQRATKETRIEVELGLDGTGVADVSTGVPFFDHMLAQLAKHGLLDLEVAAEGDTEIDAHHTVEDTAITLGQVLREALGDKAGISRFGDAVVPLDETLARAAVDVSGRPYLVHDEPAGMVVVDEAYAELARDGTPSALALLPRYRRLVVTRTMSKAFALAGARVGYLAADLAVIEALLLVRLPYHLSAVTQAVARAALAHAAEPLATVQALRAERDKLVDWLRGQGLAVADSDANFVLFGEFGDAHAIWQALLERGVLIRETGPPGWLRVTAGTPAEMGAFRDALLPVLAGAREEAHQ